MLPTYPETLLDRAVDGVIQASSLQQASELARVQAFARRQITREREQARLEVAELRAAAAFEGYRDGVLHALGAVQGVIEGMQQAHVTLANAVRDHVHTSLQAMNAAPDAVMEPICSAFLHRMTQVGAGLRPVLHVPQHHDALMAALRADPRLHALDIRPADRQLPLLELGALAWELDLQGSLLEDVELALSRALPGVQDRLNASAAHYSARLLDTLDIAAQTQGLARIKETQ
ncbi:hypothetical protein [Stenotrophomonas sp. CFBP 13718]|uniref:hypothetical protein n=1 Tax=Stenotrophomonas sp. CFBP 13718 TaxID=2775304 RepID=UPI0017808411|nr:hypothetical protein [Stenotrophomonas sp. CFBP 13718]MBD8697311.1 hypothetical protein [Stenotrophomonas sp. CFBP 13718]